MSQPQPEDQLTISFKAMQRMRTTIEDFVQSYFPYAALKVPQDLFKYLDVLVWVEASIYQLDEDNEALARQGKLEPGRCLLGESVLPQVLSAQGLMDDAIEAQLKQGDLYWQGERRLCTLMLQRAQAQQQSNTGLSQQGEGIHQDVPQTSTLDSAGGGSQGQVGQTSVPKRRRLATCQATAAAQSQQGSLMSHEHDQQGLFTLEEVLKVHEAKSFDYRLLHLLLRKLSRAPHDQLIMDFLFVDELLVDIGDDLVDYEDDIEANSFNILRAYVHLYGKEAPLKLVERISELEELHSKLLAQLPAHLQQHYWCRHQAAAGEEQGAGKWVFPPLVLDEAAFRHQLASDSSLEGT